MSKVDFAREGDVVTITLNDPATRNALSWELSDDLGNALDHVGDARAVILTGAGKGFCSGGDMSTEGSEGRAFGEVVYEGLHNSVNPMLRKLANVKVPVICAVHGAAAGAGAPLALSADFTIAGESAFFYFAFPNVGLALDAGASWLLPRLVGTARATEALMLAERIPAQQALDWGMIHKVVPDEDVLDTARLLASRLAGGPTVSYGQIKRAMRYAQGSTYDEALTEEEGAQYIAGNTADCKEAVQAFLEKRKPVFQGK
ncbi:MAG: enoyl-CoA hydratase-related protein [Sphingomonadaceae bacterium]